MPDEWWMLPPAEHEVDPEANLDLGDDHWQPYSGVVVTDVAAPVELIEPHPELRPAPEPPPQPPAELSAIDWVRLTGQPPPEVGSGPATLSPAELLAELEARSSDPLVRDLVERLRETYG